jgi:hypothetical protein
MNRWDVAVDVASWVNGRIAEDKDVARKIGSHVVLRAMAASQRIHFDFTGIGLATQSFVHACLSEAIRKYGRVGLKRMTFHGCAPAVRSVINTVVSYSLDFAMAKGPSPLMTSDVPQADDLSTVRTVVKAAAAGASNVAEIARRTGFSDRHTAYRVNAARILGLLSPPDVFTPTADGLMLLETPVGSSEEALLFRRCVEQSAAFKRVAPDLFEDPPPSRTAIAERLRQLSGLKKETAGRRAQTLVSWRRQLVARTQGP